MNSEDIKSYLSNIEEALFDEKRIVTCSWLSKTFGIHCNVSKQLLHTFYENSPKKEELSVTYLLIGQSNDGASRHMLIVKDNDLPEVEENLNSITTKHIYSIQKCQDLSDINVLFTPPADESVDVVSKGISAIDFNNKERDNALIAQLRHNALPAVPTPPVAPAKKANSQSVTKAKSPVKNAKDEDTEKCANTEKDADSTVGNKKSVIPSMFNNATGPKKKPVGKAAATVKKPHPGIGAFFTKTANKSSPTNEPKKVPDSHETTKVETESKEMDTKLKERLSPLKENKATLNICTEDSKGKKEASPKETVVKAKKVDNKPKSTSKKATNKGGKKKAIKKGGNDQKKRKRLVVLSDSDSNSGSEDEEVMREPTPEPEPTFIPDDDMDDVVLGTPEPSKKRKKRKLVSKTFAGPDGFMVTEKHYEDVSASEEEEPMPEKKFKGSSPQEDATIKNAEKLPEKKESPKIKSPSPQKTKQSSLTSFFKKK